MKVMRVRWRVCRTPLFSCPADKLKKQKSKKLRKATNHHTENTFSSCTFLKRRPAANSPTASEKAPEHTHWKGLMLKILTYFKSFRCCLPELAVGRREIVVDGNVLATGRIALLTPEDADNLSAAQRGRLNVTRRPNQPLMKAWRCWAEPRCRARCRALKP